MSRAFQPHRIRPTHSLDGWWDLQPINDPSSEAAATSNT